MGDLGRGGTVGYPTKATRYLSAALGCGVMLATAAPAAAAQVRPKASAARSAAPATVPGMPGSPPTPVFTEDFQNRQSALPVRLDGYTGASGMTYTANPGPHRRLPRPCLRCR